MSGYIQQGRYLTIAAPYALASAGLGCLVVSLFGVSQSAAGSGDDVVIDTEGVHELAKVGTQAWAVGAKVYWDDTNKHCTTTASTHKQIGVAVEAVGGGANDVLGKVRLSAAFTI